ncbi:tyrosine-type recombinase/integrase [Methylobacterium aquaticum]|uniref:tyrosine-type recombinase/integrase n=1 Tax=Methylobacterium aquaticum TaxID=270351 RepID=UPI003D17D67F
MAKVLTVRAIEALKPGPGRAEIPDGLIAGLYLVVQPTGRKSWAVRYRSAGRTRKHTIGAYPGIDLSNARELARRTLVAVASGRDPGAEKAEARRSGEAALRAERDRFDRAAESYIERYAKANTKADTWRESQRLLAKNVVPLWKARRLQDIAKRDIIDLLDTIVDRGSPVAANRVLAVLRRMFGWFVERGVLTANPCAGVKAPTAEKSRDRVLADDELRTLWQACVGLSEPFGSLVRLLMLTGQRRDEVGQMTWTEVDLDAKLWTIPKERAKNGQAHDVPLSDQAVAVLSGIKRITGDRQLVFTTTGETPVSGFSKAKRRLDKAMPGAAPWVLHDLRRTMASGMARLGISLPVIEKVLNHTSGSFGGIVGVYQRHTFADEKRIALGLWAQHVQISVYNRSPT